MKLPVNTIMLADAYKYTHWLQIPEKTEYIELHEMARGSNIPEIDYTRQFGLQGFLKDYLEGRVIEPWMLDEADETLQEYSEQTNISIVKAFNILLMNMMVIFRLKFIHLMKV